MGMIDMIELKLCPFCGADALLKWVLSDHAIHNGHGGKSLRVSCSRDGECPSPSWTEQADEHEDDAACLVSVTTFWNTRADDWAADELIEARVKLVQAHQELRIVKLERDRAMKSCEQIGAYRTAEGAKS
jgi:hypothetical protein